MAVVRSELATLEFLKALVSGESGAIQLMSKWEDPLGMLAGNILMALSHTLDLLQVTQNRHSGIYDVTVGKLALDRIHHTVTHLQGFTELVRRYQGTSIWPLVARIAKLGIGQSLQCLRVDVCCLHAAFHSVVSSPGKDGDQFAEHLRSTKARCAAFLKMHISQFNESISDAKSLIDDLFAHSKPTTASSVETPKPLVLSEEVEGYRKLLGRFNDARLSAVASLVADDETLSQAQVQLINDRYIDIVVGVMGLYHSIVKHYNEYQEESAKHRLAVQSHSALGQLKVIIEGALQSAIERTAVLHLDASLAAELLVHNSTTFAEWMRKFHSVPAVNVTRDESRTDDEPVMQFLLSVLTEGPRHVSTTVSLIKKLEVQLKRLQEIAERLLNLIGQVVESHASVLFSAAQGLNAVLVESQTLMESLKSIGSKLSALLAYEPDSTPEAIVMQWLRTNQQSLFTSRETFAAHEAAAEAHYSELMNSVNELLRALRPLPCALQLLFQSIDGLPPHIQHEASQAEAIIVSSKLGRFIIKPSEKLRDSPPPVELSSATIQVHQQLERLVYSDESSPSSKMQLEVLLEDSEVVKTMFLSLIQDYLHAETAVSEVGRWAASQQRDIISNEEREEKEGHCSRVLRSFCTAIEMLGKQLCLTEESLDQIGNN